MRLTPEIRREQILKAGIALALDGNYNTITRAAVAKLADCAEPLVTHYYGSIDNLRHQILLFAIDNRSHTILQQAIINRDKTLETVPRELLQEAVGAIEI